MRRGLSVKITGEELRYMALLHDITGVSAKDCIIDEEDGTIIFIVPPGQAGIAVGAKGRNVRRISKILGRRIEIVEWADTLEDFVKNLFLPARVLGINLNKTPDGRKVLYVRVDPHDKGIAIGKNGRNVHKARLVLKRYYGVDVVSIV
ncbi:MAG: NusA-like transcription termination signal-binding factor [Desulfurococcales archaeon]|nr:NusA-like transcription termination signal-binding factor [Desulfurococcales archaeon]RLG78387.1 MAG: NusA-like transcription termination signal-binding factor [Thermoprotei archaeon]